MKWATSTRQRAIASAFELDDLTAMTVAFFCAAAVERARNAC
jgi:hypothetical protein